MAKSKGKRGAKKPAEEEEYEPNASDDDEESEGENNPEEPDLNANPEGEIVNANPEEANVSANPERANGNANAAGGGGAVAAAPVISVTDEFYVEMYQRMGFREKAAKELVLSEEINTRAKLERITSSRAYSICKAIRSPGGTSRGSHVTEGAQHNPLMVANVFNNSSRVSRPIGPLDVQSPPNDMFDLHESQLTMELGWDNATMSDTFKPLTSNDTRRGWKPVFDDFE